MDRGTTSRLDLCLRNSHHGVTRSIKIGEAGSHCRAPSNDDGVTETPPERRTENGLTRRSTLRWQGKPNLRIHQMRPTQSNHWDNESRSSIAS